MYKATIIYRLCMDALPCSPKVFYFVVTTN